MAKKPQVTRTMKTTNATFLCLDVQSAEPQNITVTLPRVYADEKALLKVARPMVETDTLKLVSVVDTSVSEQLYTMDEDFFLSHATPVIHANTEAVSE